MVTRPPASQSSRMRPAWGTTRAMSPVVMKIPVPRIAPTVTRVASQTPRPFTSSGAGAPVSGFDKVRGFYLDEGESGTLAARMAEEIQIRAIRERRDFDACIELQRAIWKVGDLEVVSAVEM